MAWSVATLGSKSSTEGDNTCMSGTCLGATIEHESLSTYASLETYAGTAGAGDKLRYAILQCGRDRTCAWRRSLLDRSAVAIAWRASGWLVMVLKWLCWSRRMMGTCGWSPNTRVGAEYTVSSCWFGFSSDRT